MEFYFGGIGHTGNYWNVAQPWRQQRPQISAEGGCSQAGKQKNILFKLFDRGMRGAFI
jgi:hypothetical protein